MSKSTQSSERIRLGVIGCGPITLNAHADAIAKAANIQLGAIADRDELLLSDMPPSQVSALDRKSVV